MPVSRIATFCLPLLLCLAGGLRADTVILKSGEKVDGKILSETDSEMTISVNVTATIKDERVVKKTEIDKVLKVSPDSEAWTPLMGLTPGVDSLELDDYSRVILALQYFITSHPESTFVPQAKERLATFTDEQKLVEQGQMKVEGQWLTKERVAEERVQIGGRILLNRMKRSASVGLLTEAMAIFDQMEKGFNGSASYPEAVEYARQILPPLKVAVEQRQAQYKRRTDDEKRRLVTAKGTERDQLAAIVKSERTKAEATIAAIEKAGVKWLPLHPVTERSLAALATRTAAEATRLKALPIEKMRDAVKSAEVASSALIGGDIERAEKALQEATSAWAGYELLKRLQPKLAELKKAATGAKQNAPKAAPPPAPANAPKTSRSTISVPAEPVKENAPSVPSPSFGRPLIPVAVAAVMAFGVVAAKGFGKFRSAGANLPDR